MRLKECDTVFLLDYPLETCLAGAKSRVGVKREEYELLGKYQKGKEVIIFKTREEADDYLMRIPRNMC